MLPSFAMETTITEKETDASPGEAGEVKINPAQPDFTVIMPMAVQALIIAADFAQTTHQIAPLIQPDYSCLLQGPHAGEPTHDLMDSLDMSFWRMQARYNPRFIDLVSGQPRRDRQGVYLSWCLPRTYRAGIAATASALATEEGRRQWGERRIRSGYRKPNGDEDSSQEQLHFRAVPDRWLVVRKVRGRPEQDRRFLIESNCIRTVDDPEFNSDSESPSAGGNSKGHDLETTTAPAMDPSRPPSEQYGLRMGRVADLTAANVKAAKAQKYCKPFNAFAQGHEFFADYQPHHMGVFSCFDDLEGVDEADLDYLIVGYHSSAEDDPLVVVDKLPPDEHGKPPKFSNAELLDGLNLLMDSKSQGRAAFLSSQASPEGRTLTHGLLRSVRWNRQVSKLVCPASTLQEDIYEHQPIAVGTDTLDALSAYLHVALDPQDVQSTATVHTLLSQLVMLVARNDDVDSQRLAADETATLSWLANAEGTVWEFPKEEQQDSNNGKRPDPSTDSQLIQLDYVNERQMMSDTCAREEAQLVQQLFGCWWKAAGLRNTPVDVFVSRKEDIQSTARQIAQRLSVVGPLKTNLQEATLREKEKLEGMIGGKKLVPVPASPFGRHQDPTILVAGVTSGWPPFFNDALPVRLASEIAPVQETNPSRDWVDELLSGICGPYKSLLREFEENDPNTRRDRWKENPYWSVEEMGDTQGWFPLFLEWEIEYYNVPFARWSLEPSEVTGHWYYVIEGGVPLPTDQSVGADVRTIQGRTAILPQPGRTLRTRLEQLFERSPTTDASEKAKREEMLRKLSDVEYFSAPLAGLSDHLLTLRHGHHPRPDPKDEDIQRILGIELKYLAMLQEADHELAPYGASTPLAPDYTAFSPFKPVLHGQARFTKFAIVDKFGQIVSGLRPSTYGDGPGSALYPCVSPSLACDVLPVTAGSSAGDYWPNTAVQAEHGAGGCQFFQIPPRINQKARLNAHFLKPLPADDDGSKGTARKPSGEWTSPIWAWLVPNFHGDSVQVYDGDGGFALEIILDRSAETATPSLGPNIAGVTPPRKGRLGALLEALRFYRIASSVFDMLTGASDSVRSSSADFDSALPAALGRPFCVADLGLSIELAAPPRVNESLLASPEATRQPEPSLLDYEFPVVLGNPTAAFDGLVGTFSATGPIESIKSAYTRDANAAEEAGLLNAASPGICMRPAPAASWPDPLRLRPYFLSGSHSDKLAEDHDARLTCVSAIVDPKTPLHVYSGSLFPMKPVELPRWPVDASMRVMRPFFSVGPVLVPEKPSQADMHTMALTGSGSLSVQMPLAGGQGKDAWRWIQPRRDATDPKSQETLWSPMSIRPLDRNLKVEAAAKSELVEGFIAT